ncbi:hypothetical protein SNEBB_005909 [Seison nebaliae]|nr:hypothetical protein SNEBB_005909 [Seison nebaliae]
MHQHEREVLPLYSEDKQVIRRIFESLDFDKDGKIDVNDILTAYDTLSLPGKRHHAELFVKSGNLLSKSHELTFSEFFAYAIERHKTLDLVFHTIDQNEDGKIDENELKSFFERIGFNVNDVEVNQLIKRVDKDGTLHIDRDEWRQHFLLVPVNDISDIIDFWRNCSSYSTTPEIVGGDWWKHLAAGAVAGALSRTSTAPLDRLKLVMQAVGNRERISIVGGFRYLVNEGGYSSLWRGNGINVIKVAPETAMKFMFYDQFKRIICADKNLKDIKMYERFICGSFAGACSQSIIYPLEVVKTRLALSRTGDFKGMFDCAKQIYLKENFLAFYKGYIPNIMGILPYAGTDLAVYETLKKSAYKALSMSRDEQLPMPILFTCGICSTTAGMLISYPLSLIRTRMQADIRPYNSSFLWKQPINYGRLLMNSTNSFERKRRINSQAVNILREIYRVYGLRGLYRGMVPNFLKVAPAVSISYGTYEATRQFLGAETF